MAMSGCDIGDYIDFLWNSSKILIKPFFSFTTIWSNFKRKI